MRLPLVSEFQSNRWGRASSSTPIKGKYKVATRALQLASEYLGSQSWLVSKFRTKFAALACNAGLL
jgi:hypothetical protein